MKRIPNSHRTKKVLYPPPLDLYFGDIHIFLLILMYNVILNAVPEAGI